MGKRPRNRLELRAEAEAAEARGLLPEESRSRFPRTSSGESRPRSSSSTTTRMKIVWAVCDIGGRTIVTFDFPHKADAEAAAKALKARGKGEHFVRQIKEPMN